MEHEQEHEQESDMRDDLNAALEAVDETGTSYEETPQEVITPDEPEQEVEASTTADVSQDAPTGEETSTDSIKAPIDWSPKEREDWSKIPRHLQEKVISREKELNQMLQTTAEARRTSESFTQLTSHFAPVMATLQGNTPIDKVAGLVTTVAQLRMGNPVQKAAIMADLINEFGVDIHTLDSALVGAAPDPEVQQQSQLEQMLAERLAPFEQMMGQQNALVQQQAAQRQEAVNSEVIEFSKTHEFLPDVRLDMADLIDAAAARGVNMTMEEAYTKACAIHPEVSKILSERQEKERLLGGRNTLAAKRAASSSVTGRKTGAGGAENLALRDTIAAAWDNQDRI
jgi:hypothetical protein